MAGIVREKVGSYYMGQFKPLSRGVGVDESHLVVGDVVADSSSEGLSIVTHFDALGITYTPFYPDEEALEYSDVFPPIF